MSNKRRKINTSLGVVEYMAMVNDIVFGYFDILTDEYQPHFGMANAMEIFYNRFYKNPDDDDIVTIDVFEKMLEKDDDFIEKFNEAIFYPGSSSFNFANAYNQALDIVESKKNSFSVISAGIQRVLMDVTSTFNNMIDNGDIQKIVELADKLSTTPSSVKDLSKIVNIKKG